MMPHVLVIEDDANCLAALAELAEQQGFSASAAGTLAEARQHLEAQDFDLILLDLVLPDGNGFRLLKELETPAGTEIVLITGNATLDTAIEAFRLGAHDFLTKPVDLPRLKSLLARIAAKAAQSAPASLSSAPNSTAGSPNDATQMSPRTEQPKGLDLLLGQCQAMQQVYGLLARVAPSEATVLLTGESGTGKDVAAETIHRLSKRSQGPYLPLNCGAISSNLIESELFGHERGSFIGAARLHKGYFERAHGGTLFLDEISEMPLELQVKLLRVLETGKIMRVGGDRPIDVNVRVIAATNRSLDEAVESGRFRHDLLYRLRVFPIHMPPLRERDGDLDLLINHFTRQFNLIEGQDKHFSAAALEKLRAYHWPGNVRELKNMVYRSYIMAEGEIGPECLPPELGTSWASEGTDLRFRVGRTIADVERHLILATLEKFQGNKKMAAEILGISLKTLYNRLHEYDILD